PGPRRLHPAQGGPVPALRRRWARGVRALGAPARPEVRGQGPARAPPDDPGGVRQGVRQPQGGRRVTTSSRKAIRDYFVAQVLEIDGVASALPYEPGPEALPPLPAVTMLSDLYGQEDTLT